MRKLVLVLILILCSPCFADWDNDLPGDEQAWNDAAGSIRDNWDALETAFGVDLADTITDANVILVYNVKDSTYGAEGDGETDDSTAIQAAIDAAETAGGGIVYFPEGTYDVATTLTISGGMGVSLQGSTRGSSIIHNTQTGGEHCLTVSTFTTNSQWFGRIRDMQFTGNASSGSGVRFGINTTHGLVENVRCYNHGGAGIELQANTFHTLFINVYCTYNGTYGFYLWDGGGATHPNANTFINCQATHNQNHGLFLDEGNGNLFFGGSYEDNGEGGTGYGWYLERGSSNQLIGGWLEGNADGGYYVGASSHGNDIRPGRMLQTSYMWGSNTNITSPHTQGSNPEGVISSSWTSGLVGDLLSGFGHTFTILPPDFYLSAATRVTDTRGIYGQAIKLLANADYASALGIKSPAQWTPGVYRTYFYLRSDTGVPEVTLQVRNTTDSDTRAQKTSVVVDNTGAIFYPYPTGGLSYTIDDSENGDVLRHYAAKESGSDTDPVYLSHVVTVPVPLDEVTLLSVTRVYFNANADTILFTVPTGYRCILDHAKIVVGGDAGSTDITIGRDGTETDFIGTDADRMDNVDAQYDTVTLYPDTTASPATVLKTYAAGVAIEMNVASQAGHAVNYVWLYGTLINDEAL